MAVVQTYYLPHIEIFLFQNKVQHENGMFFWLNKESELHLLVTLSCQQYRTNGRIMTRTKQTRRPKKNVDPAYRKPRMPTMVAKNYYSLKESARKRNSSLPNVPDSESESEGSGNLKGGDSGGNKPKEAKVSIFYLLLV